MPRVCFILLAGLDRALLAKSPSLPTLASFAHQAVYKPAFPAVTSASQATLTTGAEPEAHGIVCNGLYTHGQGDLRGELDLSNHAETRQNVSFWEQSNGLLRVPRFWQRPGFAKKVAMLFWQNSMPARVSGSPAADVVITPKPEHTPDGKTLTACWSSPADLYGKLASQLGPFPLHNYWSPMAGLPSSQWIARAAQQVWREHRPDLQLVYIPHLDYNPQRLGPNHPALLKDLQDVDGVLAPVVEQVRREGGVCIVAGDYGMYEVDTPVLPNLALRHAGLLATRPDAEGKVLVDYEASRAFVMADHQVAYLYASEESVADACAVLSALPGVERIDLTGGNRRAGAAVLMAAPNAWFAHDWWEPGAGDGEKPRWQFTVDIHSKPGYDPRELFFDPARKCIAQDPRLVKGSHGRTDDAGRWPMVLSDVPIAEGMTAAQMSGYVEGIVGG